MPVAAKILYNCHWGWQLQGLVKSFEYSYPYLQFFFCLWSVRRYNLKSSVLCSMWCTVITAFKPLCSWAFLRTDVTSRYAQQSSAYNRMRPDAYWLMSFINIKKRRDPKTHPWGTPDSTSSSDEFTPSRTTAVFHVNTSTIDFSKIKTRNGTRKTAQFPEHN